MYAARITLTIRLEGSPDDAAARLTLARRLRQMADDLERDARPAPDGGADGCAWCWYVDQLEEHTASTPQRTPAIPHAHPSEEEIR